MKNYFLVFLISLGSVPAYSQWWAFANRESAGIAPLPEDAPEAIVHVYGARAARWRGYVAIHSWIATKEKGASHYKVYDVNGFRLYRGAKVVAIQEDTPDRHWYGNKPELLYDQRGPEAEKLIPLIHKAALTYPYQDQYRAWPGPNSNTFISHIIRSTPGFYIELPPHALGKDWINKGDLVGVSESGTGVQLSLLGALGLTVGLGEGIEINVLGLSFGIDFLRPAIKLPLVGRVGMSDRPVFGGYEAPPKNDIKGDGKLSPTRTFEMKTR